MSPRPELEAASCRDWAREAPAIRPDTAAPNRENEVPCSLTPIPRGRQRNPGAPRTGTAPAGTLVASNRQIPNRQTSRQRIPDHDGPATVPRPARAASTHEMLEFMNAPSQAENLERYRARGYAIQGDRSRLVTDWPQSAVAVQPPSAKRKEKAGVMVEYYRPGLAI